MKLSDLKRRELLTATVDRISNNGNGVIQFEDGHIILGPMERDAVGEEVEFIYRGGNTAVSTSEYMKDSHESGRGEDKETHISDPQNKNKLLNGNQ